MGRAAGEGEIIGGTYQVIRQIGKGGSGLVYLAYHLNLRKYVVLKRVAMRFGSIETLRAETDILKNLHHSYVPQVYDFVVRDGEVFTVMDYIEGTSLEKLLLEGRRFSERQLRSMLLQLAQVLAYLHKNRPAVIHSDIKPDNLILRPDGNICLIDFNISVSDGVGSSLSGYSMHFASPEQCRRFAQIRYGGRSNIVLDARTDIYSAGALFYCLITGRYCDTRLPRTAGTTAERPGIPGGGFAGGNGAGVVMDPGVLYRDMLACGYSEVLCRVIARCLEPNPNRRYKNGARLYAAVQRLSWQDRRFQAYLALRAASWLLSALLIGGGSWLLIRGMQQKVREEYTASWTAFEQKVREGDADAASELGTDILNETRYGKILSDNPENAAEITRVLADHAYEREQYDQAGEYYEQALNYAKDAGEAASRYYRDYAISLIMDGQLHRAERVMEEASGQAALSGGGVDEPDSLLVQAYIQLHKEEPDEETCIAIVRRILETSPDGDLRARACVLAAEACERKGGENNDEERVAWLKQALDYSGEAKYRRIAAAAFIEQAQDTGRSLDQRKYSAKDALAIYQSLADGPRALLDDQFSCVNLTQFLAGFGEPEERSRLYGESLRRLRSMEEQGITDYRIPMYRAFAYDGMGDLENSKKQAREALDMYHALSAREQAAADPEAVRFLEQLQ